MSNQYGPRIITDGLVLCLDAGNSKSYPGTGTVWTDLSGNNNNGTLTNGPAYSSANRGSIAFDGTDDKVSCGSSGLNNLISFSLLLWINKISSSSGGNGFDRLIAKRSSGGSGWWDLYTSSTHTIALSADFITTDIVRETSNTISLNKWNMVSCTWDGSSSASNIKFYINNLETSYTTTTNGVGGRASESTNVAVIGGGDFGNRPFYGNMSQILVYNKVLSLSDIQQNYNATKGRYAL